MGKSDVRIASKSGKSCSPLDHTKKEPLLQPVAPSVALSAALCFSLSFAVSHWLLLRLSTTAVAPSRNSVCCCLMLLPVVHISTPLLFSLFFTSSPLLLFSSSSHLLIFFSSPNISATQRHSHPSPTPAPARTTLHRLTFGLLRARIADSPTHHTFLPPDSTFFHSTPSSFTPWTAVLAFSLSSSFSRAVVPQKRRAPHKHTAAARFPVWSCFDSPTRS